MATLDEESGTKFQCNDGIVHYASTMFTAENCPYVYTIINGKFSDCGHRTIFLNETVATVKILFEYIKGEFEIASAIIDLRPAVRTAERFLMLKFIQDVLNIGILSVTLKADMASRLGLKYTEVCVYDGMCDACRKAIPTNIVVFVPRIQHCRRHAEHGACIKLTDPSKIYDIVFTYVDYHQHTHRNNHIWSLLVACHSNPHAVLAYVAKTMTAYGRQRYIAMQRPNFHTSNIIEY
jgi:hypothetical protein